MVAEHHDEGATETTCARQVIDRPADLDVGGGDFAVVGADHGGRKAVANGLRRVVRRMRLVEVYPRQERLRGILIEPFDRLRHYLAARSPHGVETAIDAVLREIEVVVIPIQSLRDS